MKYPILLLLSVLGVPRVFAQAAPAPGSPDPNSASLPTTAQVAVPTAVADEAKADEAVKLNPFVVTDSDDRGYEATSTLSGTRIKSSLAELSAPVSVYTKQFMEDIGAPTIEDMFLYSTNIQNREDDQQGGGMGLGVTYVLNNNVGGLQFNNQMRGLTGATFSSSFFRDLFSFDTYNTGRVTVSDGPNGLLFGLGSPAGIVDVPYDHADLYDHEKIESRFDSFGSQRVNLNVNRVVIPDILAIRVAALYDDQEFWVKPSFDRRRSVYAAVTANLTKKTALYANFEVSARDYNRPSTTLFTDGVSRWLNGNSATAGAFPDRATFDNSKGPAATSADFTAAASYPTYISGSNIGFYSWYRTAVTRPQSAFDTNPFDLLTAWSFTNNKIVPYNFNILGNGSLDELHDHHLQLFLDQEVTKDLNFEVAFDYEVLDQKAEHELAVSNGVVYADPNLYIPEPGGVYAPNPNVGRFYVQGTDALSGEGNMLKYSYEAIRSTGSYEYRFGDHFGPTIGKWLGTLRLAGLLENSEQTQLSQGTARLIDDQNSSFSFLQPTAATTAKNWAIDPSRQFASRYYFNAGQSTVFHPYGEWFQTWTGTDPGTGQTWHAYSLNNPYGYSGAPQATLLPLNSASLSAQSLLWDKRIIFTGGAREDWLRVKKLVAADSVQEANGLYPILDDNHPQWADTSSWQNTVNYSVGVVVAPVSWFNVYANWATDYGQETGFIDVYNHLLPGATGSGKDVGFRVELMPKLSLRVDYYIDADNGIRAIASVDDLPGLLYNLESRMETLDPGLAPSPGISPSTQAVGNYQSVEDEVAKGFEIELQAEPIQNLRVLLNAAQQRVTQTNLGVDALSFLTQRLPTWQAATVVDPVSHQTVNVFNNYTEAVSGVGDTLQQYYADTILPKVLYIQALNGQSTTGTAFEQPWRSNLVANYDFTAGALKGFTVGGAARWRSAPVIGYNTPLVNGQYVLDVSHPIYGTSHTEADANIGYRGVLHLFSRKKLAYRLALNVRNVLNYDKLEYLVATSDGVDGRYAYPTPRDFIFSMSIDY